MSKKNIALLILCTLMLTACSKEKKADYTEAENALQASLIGYWTDDMGMFERTVAEENGSVMVLEFTEDYNYFLHECDFSGWQIKTYEPTEYSFEEMKLKIDSNGEEAYAKLEISEDGNTLYWITDENTYDYTRIPEETIRKIGVPDSNPEKETDMTDSSGNTTETENPADGIISPGGYLLDPALKFDLSDSDMEFTEHAVMIAETDDIRIYGIYPYEKEPVVFIEHDGVIDEFEQNWMTPRQVLPAVMHSDIDGDGKKELAVSYYTGSGAGISIEELVVYKAEDNGHFTDYHLDAEEIIDDYVNYIIDNDNSWIDFAAYGTDELYSTSTAADYPDGIEDISFGLNVSFILSDDKIELHTVPAAAMMRYECMPEIAADVIFDGKDFELENIDFMDS